MVQEPKTGSGGEHRSGVTTPADSPPPLSDVVQLLQELVRIPSVNPDGDPGAENTGEKACAEYIGRFLERCGAEVCYEEVRPERPNVIGRFPSQGNHPGRRILLAPHTDTVGVANMTIDPFAAEIREGRLYGRGASDTKGTAAAMLWALLELRDTLPDLAAEITFVGLMGEETGQPGSRHFAARHGNDFDFAIIGEPTDLQVVYTHKGCLWVEVGTRGIAAHGSMPEQGDNAILKMARLLTALDTDFREELAAHRDPVLGPSTINIGICEGGSRANVVADRCRAVLDLRVTPDLSCRNALGLLETFLRKHDPGVSLQPLLECSPLATDPQHPVVERLLSLGGDASDGGGEITLQGAPWFCDAAVLAEGGIPGIAAGPGSIRQAHTEDEYIHLEDLEKGVRFYRALLESFAQN